jgi:hypothetical protein
MLRQIKNLLQDPSVKDKLQAAASRAEAIKLLVAAGADKGYQLTAETVAGFLAALQSGPSRELSEQELLGVSGGRMADTGHPHMSCCGDCPPTQGVCGTA